MAYSKQAGLALATMDGFLAATALANGLTLATRNTKDFARFGLSLINPWDLP
jgi:predicted nucleic acid-binding protein